MRKVTIFQSQTSESQILDIEDSIKTWGDLKPLIEFDLENKKVVVQQTSVTLDLPEAELPAGDLTLFVFVSQSKAGASSIDYSTPSGQNAVLKTISNANIRRTIRRYNEKGTVKIDESLPTEQQRKLFAAHFRGESKKPAARRTLSKIEKKPAKAPAKKKTPVKKKAVKKELVEFKETPPTKAPAEKKDSAKMNASGEQIQITLNVDQGKVIDKLDKISERMDDAISRLEELPGMIADKIKETSKIVKAAKELKTQASKMKQQLIGVA